MNTKRILIFFVLLILIIPLTSLVIKQLSKKDINKVETVSQKIIPTPHFQNPNQNIILISIDTVDPSHMGVYGYPKKTTPQIDEFARKATVFTQLYTLIPHTFDSFYTLFTGRDDVLKDEEINQTSSTISEWGPKKQTLPKILKQNGYKTVAFVTNHVIGTITPFFKINFEEFNFINTSKSTDPGLESFIPDYQNSQKVTEGALEWLSKNGDQKFFLWLHYTNPHMPYNPPLEDLCQIDPTNCKADIYQTYLKDPLKSKSVLDDCTKPKSKQVVDTMRNLYDGELVSADREVGQFLKYLKDTNLYQNSTIIFYADHGESFNHNIFEHGYDLYHNGVHLPLIIKDKNLTPGSKIDTLMDNSDIIPTILGMTELEYDTKDFTGNDINGAKKKDFVYLLAEPYKGNKYGVFDGTFKFIYSDEPGCFYQNYREELYNLKTDPLEMTNLIGSDAKKAKELKTKLSGEIESWGKVKNVGGLNKSQEVIDKLRQLGY